MTCPKLDVLDSFLEGAYHEFPPPWNKVAAITFPLLDIVRITIIVLLFILLWGIGVPLHYLYRRFKSIKDGKPYEDENDPY